MAEYNTPGLPDALPDSEPELKGDQDNDDPFKEVGVLDTDFIGEHGVIFPDHIDLPAHALAPQAAPEHF
jgi:hypothetical protein